MLLVVEQNMSRSDMQLSGNFLKTNFFPWKDHKSFLFIEEIVKKNSKIAFGSLQLFQTIGKKLLSALLKLLILGTFVEVAWVILQLLQQTEDKPHM